jgi:N-acetylneuraminic acid mutarotase
MKRTKNFARHRFGLILLLVSLMIVATFVLEPVTHAQVNPSWIPTGSLNTPRWGHTATLLANGKVLVIEGDDSGSSAELYEPGTGTWSITASLHTPRYAPTATLLLNGKVLVAGGYNLNSAELYDPNAGTWSVTGSLLGAH